MNNKSGLFLILILLVSSVYLFGCKSLKQQVSNDSTQSETEETVERVDTPEDTLGIIIKQIDDEMRVFDVGDHHEALIGIIMEKAVTLEAEEIRPMIKETVEIYMDAYFMSRIKEVLRSYNERFTDSDVDMVFKSTSRTALYELIELYEWTFYKNK